MYLVAGLGVTGQSVLRYFHRQGEACLAFDTRESFDASDLQAEYPEIEFACGQLPSSWRQHIHAIVLSPGLAKSADWLTEFCQAGIPIIGDIELFARTAGEAIVAITGSNGKSTVATLTAEVLEAAGYRVGLGGNIGVPALDLLTHDQKHDVYVLELSSFQLETTHSLQCRSATVLNISEDHMDRYHSLNDYIQAKMTILNNTEWAVLNNDFAKIPNLQQVLFFGLLQADHLPDNQYGVLNKNHQAWLGYGDQPLMKLDEMALQGEHHWLNALATMALCHPFEVLPQHYQQVFSRFRGLPHRTQLVLEKDGVQWINDSKGTNVGATLTAIQSQAEQIKGKIILLAGGVGKGADFSPLTSAVQQHCRQVILFGRDRATLAAHFPNALTRQVEDLSTAIDIARQQAESGDCVLFSPACASFDQYANYIARGEAFEALVKQKLLS